MIEKKSQNLKEFLKQQYKGDGVKCELTSRHAIRYSYFHKIKIEIENILRTLEVLKTIELKKDILDTLPFGTEQKILLRQSIWYAIVVNYAKFFTAKDKDDAVIKHVKLERKDCYKNVSSILLDAHDYLIEIRNKLIAHGTKNDQEEVIPVLYLNLIPENNEVSCRLGINAIAPISLSTDDLQKKKIYLRFYLDTSTKKLMRLQIKYMKR